LNAFPPFTFSTPNSDIAPINRTLYGSLSLIMAHYGMASNYPKVLRLTSQMNVFHRLVLMLKFRLESVWVRKCSPGSNPGLSAVKTKAYETIFLDFASLFSYPKLLKSDITPIFKSLILPRQFHCHHLRYQMTIVFFCDFDWAMSHPATDHEDVDAGH